MVLQSVSDGSDSIGAYTGAIGPFSYMLDMNLDINDLMNSAFMVNLSFMGVRLLDVHLNAQNPTATIGATVLGVGVTGVVGADFEQKRVYVSATLKYAIGEKKFEFDLYNWGGLNIQMIPVIKNSSDGNHSAADAMQMLLNSDAGGSITVRNNGGYVAKIKMDYTLNGQRIKSESDSFTLGVNKKIDIPANATDIQVELLAAWFIGSWSSIFAIVFDSPVRKKYEIYGTTLNPKYKEI